MFGSEVIDTAIGLVFVFLLVSMLVTIVNELISAVLLSRAKWLNYGVQRLLGSQWAQKLYEHPLIEGTAANDKAASFQEKLAWRGSGPSYISSRAFTDVLLHIVHSEDEKLLAVIAAIRAELAKVDVATGSAAALHAAVMTAATQAAAGAPTAVVSDLARFLADRKDAFVAALLGDLQQRAGLPDGDDLRTLRGKLADLVTVHKDLTPQQIDDRLTEAFKDIADSAGKAALLADLGAMRARISNGYTVGNAIADIGRFVDAMPLKYLQESIDRIPNAKVSRTLHVLLADANQDIEHFKQNIEVWFNNAMDRVSGWYKRRSQWVVGALGIVAAVGLNVDSMAVVDYLQTHASVRDALVAKAEAYAQTPPSTTDDVKVLETQFAGVTGELTGLGLPVGWSRDPKNDKPDPYHLVFRADVLGAAISFHLLGWLVTALAATLGAPFWFDTLNRIISIRSAGKAPEEKPRPPKVVPQPLEPGQSP